MSKPTSATSGEIEARRQRSVASVNSDGTLKWFIPPYVIPAVIVVLVVARAIGRA